VDNLQLAARHIQPLGPEMKAQKSAGARKGNLRPKQERRDDDIIHVSQPPRPITSCVTGLIPHIDKRQQHRFQEMRLQAVSQR
jgi:hypothetical protein